MDLTYQLNGVTFEWNADKASKVLNEHAVTFEEAASVFLDFNEVTIQDNRFDYIEERFITIGISNQA